MDKRMSESLDRYITGNYGEDQFRGDELEVCECEDDSCEICNPTITEEDEYCDEDCSCCKMRVNYTIFDTEDDGYID